MSHRSDELLTTRLSRRALLRGAGQAGLTAAMLGAAAAARAQSPDASIDPSPASSADPSPGSSADPSPGPSSSGEPFPPLGPDLVEPEVLDLKDGVVTLTAAISTVEVGGRPVQAMVYNDSWPAPTIRMRAGDTLRIKLLNQLEEPTNLHAHGFHTTPDGRGDNVLDHLAPDDTWDIEMPTLPDHSPGLYWYHPHVHEHTDDQVNGGLAGAIVNLGDEDELPGIKGLKERLLIFQATQWDADGALVPVDQQTPHTVTRYVNGQINPVIRMRPREVQRWRVLNAASDAFLNLSVDGHQLIQIAADSNSFRKATKLDDSMIEPGSRGEFLVRAGKKGTYSVRQGPFEGDPGGIIATVIVEGDKADKVKLPTDLLPEEDLRARTVDVKRELTFDILKGPVFVIDDEQFQLGRIDQSVQLGAVEEWTVRNASSSTHPFHIHVNDFQITHINGEPYEWLSHRDTVSVPANGSITFLCHFKDFPGTAVYHCHLLEHEDGGMMGIFQVAESAAAAPAAAAVIKEDPWTLNAICLIPPVV